MGKEWPEGFSKGMTTPVKGERSADGCRAASIWGRGRRRFSHMSDGADGRTATGRGPLLGLLRCTGGRRRVAAVVLAAVLLLAVAARPTLAYFTDQHWASGGMPIQTPVTDIRETYGNEQKHVVVTNDADSVPVYVRARVYSSLPYEATGDAWYPGGEDWYIFAPVVQPGEETTELTVRIEFPVPNYDENGDHDADPLPGDQYNIVVVYEAEEATFDTDGNPLPASWVSEGGE